MYMCVIDYAAYSIDNSTAHLLWAFCQVVPLAAVNAHSAAARRVTPEPVASEPLLS